MSYETFEERAMFQFFQHKLRRALASRSCAGVRCPPGATDGRWTFPALCVLAAVVVIVGDYRPSHERIE